MGKLHQYGQLDEDKLFEFAHSLKLEETTVALSLLCDLPVDVVERALFDKNREVIDPGQGLRPELADDDGLAVPGLGELSSRSPRIWIR